MEKSRSTWRISSPLHRAGVNDIHQDARVKCGETSFGFLLHWLVHGSGVSRQASPCHSTWTKRVLMERFSLCWGSKGVFAYCVTCMLCPPKKSFQGRRGQIQHCLHSEHDNINNSLTIIVRSHCVVQSCGISMYHYDPHEPRPRSSPLWGPQLIVHAHGWRAEKKNPCSCFHRVFLFYKRSLISIPRSLLFSAKDFSLKKKKEEQSLSVVRWLHFFSELILSRVENSVVLPCFVKWQSGRNTWCAHIFPSRRNRKGRGMKETLAGLRDFVMAGDFPQ